MGTVAEFQDLNFLCGGNVHGKLLFIPCGFVCILTLWNSFSDIKCQYHNGVDAFYQCENYIFGNGYM